MPRAPSSVCRKVAPSSSPSAASGTAGTGCGSARESLTSGRDRQVQHPPTSGWAGCWSSPRSPLARGALAGAHRAPAAQPPGAGGPFLMLKDAVLLPAERLRRKENMPKQAPGSGTSADALLSVQPVRQAVPIGARPELCARSRDQSQRDHDGDWTARSPLAGGRRPLRAPSGDVGWFHTRSLRPCGAYCRVAGASACWPSPCADALVCVCGMHLGSLAPAPPRGRPRRDGASMVDTDPMSPPLDREPTPAATLRSPSARVSVGRRRVGAG